MKKTRILFALALTFACLRIIAIVTVSAVTPQPSAHGSAQSGDLMLTVSAVQHQDGIVDGHATFRNRATNTKVDIDIDSLAVGSEMLMGGGFSKFATLTGIISRSSSGGCVVNTQVSFMVRDNGEGPNAPPDQFTPPCGMMGGEMDSSRGNIVVTADELAN